MNARFFLLSLPLVIFFKFLKLVAYCLNSEEFHVGFIPQISAIEPFFCTSRESLLFAYRVTVQFATLEHVNMV